MYSSIKEHKTPSKIQCMWDIYIYTVASGGNMIAFYFLCFMC